MKHAWNEFRVCHTPSEEYLSLVAYYAQDIPAPAETIASMVRETARTLAADRVEEAIGGFLYTPMNGSQGQEDHPEFEGDPPEIIRENVAVCAELDRLAGASKNGAVHALHTHVDRFGASQPAYDFAWAATYGAAEFLPQRQSDAYLVVAIRAEIIRQSSAASAGPLLVDRLLDLMLDAGALYYLHAELRPIDENTAGLSTFWKGLTFQANIRWELETELWLRAGLARRSKVRGIYWGNYLSREHLAQLGPVEEFVNQYVACRSATMAYRFRNHARRLPGGGVFLKLTDDPMHYSRSGFHGGGYEPAAWLYARFRDAGLFL